MARGFYNLLMLMHNWVLPAAIWLLNDSTLRMIQLQFTAGQVTSLAIEQATAQRLAAALLVPQLEQSVVLQENAL